MRMTTTVALVPGSENGVGPELLLRALHDRAADDTLRFIWCGDQSSLEQAAHFAKVSIHVGDDHTAAVGRHELRFAAPVAGSLLERAAAFLRHSVELACDGYVDALVTAPIEKAALAYLDDGSHVGQTEFFATHLARDGQRPFMAFMGGPFFLSLLTTHVELSQVATRLTESSVHNHILSVATHVAQLLKRPREQIKIVILGLNPHAGEQGRLGSEETSIFEPAIERAKTLGINVIGPVAADGFFGFFHTFSTDTMPDAVIASYHDQGLIPYKLLAHGAAVNVTFGLRIPRTSPAHGTAVTLHGSGRACGRSTKEALALAINLARLSP